MGRHPTSTSFIQPIDDAGGALPPAPDAIVGPGAFTLPVGTSYFVLGGADCKALSVQIGHDEAATLTATLEVCDFPPGPGGVADHSNNGSWVPAKNTVKVDTVGQSTVATAGVVTVGGDPGGAVWEYTGGARRVRLKVEVTGAPANVRVAAWGKE